MKSRIVLGVSVFATLALRTSVDAVVIHVGSAAGAPGSTVTLSATLQTDDSLVRGVISEVEVTASTPLVSCVLNPIFEDVGTVVLKPDGCEGGVSCLSARAVLLQFSESVIADGTQLYACDFKIAAGAQGSYDVACKDASSSDPAGTDLSTTCTPGTIAVATASGCAGDCDDDNEVFGNEVTIAINIVAGTAELASCVNADADGDGEVFGNEVTIAINNVANGCPE